MRPRAVCYGPAMRARALPPVAVALAGFLALAAAMGVGRFVYTPILPSMLAGLGLTTAAAGLVASANFLGYLAGAVAAAAIGAAGPRRQLLLVALLASALTTAAMGLATSLPVFLILRFAGGAASAFVLIFASALVLDWLAAAGRSGLAAVHFAGVGAGIAISAILVAELAARGCDWRCLWVVSGAVCLASLAVVARLLPGEHGPQGTSAPARGARLDRQLLPLIAAYGLFGFGYVITATFLSTIVRTTPGLATAEPVIWLAVGLAAVPSVALWTWIGRRIGSPRAFAVAAVVEAAGVAASVLATTPPAVIAAAALLGGTFMGLTALGLTAARDLAEGDARSNIALLTASFGLGQTIGPAFAGLAHDLGGGFLLPSLVAAAALVLAAILVVGRPRERRR